MLVAENKVNNAWLAPSRELNIRITIDGVVYDRGDVNSFSFDSASIVGDAFQIGSAYMNQIQLDLVGVIESIARDTELKAEIGILIEGSFYYSKLGTFIISEFDRNRNDKKTTLSAVDKMVLMEGLYESKIAYPATIKNVALEIANLAGVEVDATSFSTLPTSTIKKPEGYTYRQAIGLIAQLVGGFANFNRDGKLQVRGLAPTNFAITGDHYLLKGFTKNEASYRINGIKVVTGEEESNILSVGSDKGNVIQLENKVMTQTLLNTVWQKVQGINYYPFELKWIGNPNLEAGDWINIVDLDGNQHSVPNLAYSFTYNGGMRADSKATTTANSDVAYRYRGPLAQKIEEIEKVLTSANGWNSNYYDQTEPPLHPKEGDAWFKPNGVYTEIWLYKNVDGELKWVLEISNAPDEAIKEAIENMEQEVQTAIDQSNTAINNANQAIADAGFAKNQSATALSQAGQAVADANTAITDAQSALDAYRNMEIGGRNLVVRSGYPDGKIPPFRSLGTLDSGTHIMPDGELVYRVKNIHDTRQGGIYLHKNVFTTPIKKGDLWTATFEVKGAGKWTSLNMEQSSNTTNDDISEIPSEWKKITFTGVSTSDSGAFIWYVTPDSEYFIRKIKVSKGNKATDWSPAPEDVQVQITNINGELSRKVSQQTFDTLQGTVNTQSTQINQNKADILLRATKTEVDTLTGTVNSLDSQIKLEAGKISTLTTKTDGHTTSIGQLQTGYSGLSSTVTQVKNNLEGMEIGGRNLWLNSSAKDSFSGWSVSNGTKTLDSTVLLNGEPTIKYVSPSTSTGGMFKTVTGGLEPNTVFTYSFMVKSSVSIPVHNASLAHMQVVGSSNLSNVHREQNMKYSPTSVPANKWTKVSVTFNTPVEAVTGETFEFRSYLWYVPNNAELYFGEFKLERGNVSTDWSPAPEYMATVTQFSSLEQTVTGIQTKVANKAEQSEVTQLAGQWSATVAQVDGHTGQISNLGDQINLRLTKAQVAAEILKDNEVLDTRNTNESPSWYHTNYPKQTVRELKDNSAIGLSSTGTYSTVTTDVGWSDGSGGAIEQTAKADSGVYQRRGAGTSWSAWSKVADTSNILSQINLSTEGVLIQGKNIWLDGNTKINDAVIKTAHIADLAVSGAKIANASISSAKIISLDASKISVGTLTGHTINGAYINGGSITGTSFFNSGADGDMSIANGRIRAKDFFVEAEGSLTSLTSYVVVRSNESVVFLQSNDEVRATKVRSVTNYTNFRANRVIAEHSMYSYGNYEAATNTYLQANDGWAGVRSLNNNVWLMGSSVKVQNANNTAWVNVHANAFIGEGGNTSFSTASGYTVVRSSGDTQPVYLQGNEIRATTVSSAGSYVAVRASAFPTGSLEAFKTNIRKRQSSALSIIRNSDIYEYNLKSELESGNQKTRIGLVIGSGYNTPSEIIDGDGVEQYAMNSLAWKAIQELDLKSTEIANEIAQIKGTHANDIFVLKSEIQELKNEIQALRQSA